VPVRTTLDELLARRRMSGKALAQAVDLSETQLSHFRSGKVRGLRFSTLAKMCFVLDCQPGELIAYDRSEGDMLVDDD
jgi:putative transcriptional regulator